MNSERIVNDLTLKVSAQGAEIAKLRRVSEEQGKTLTDLKTRLESVITRLDALETKSHEHRKIL